MTIPLSDLLSLRKGANIAYKRQRWVLKSWQTVVDFPEPLFYNESGEPTNGCYLHSTFDYID